MKKIVDAWILMWGSAYLSCSVLKSDIFKGIPQFVGFITMALLGSLMIIGLIFNNNVHGRRMLFALGIWEAIAGIASWSGVITWNVPFHDQGVVNVSMAFLDFFGSVALFTKSLEASHEHGKSQGILENLKLKMS